VGCSCQSLQNVHAVEKVDEARVRPRGSNSRFLKTQSTVSTESMEVVTNIWRWALITIREASVNPAILQKLQAQRLADYISLHEPLGRRMSRATSAAGVYLAPPWLLQQSIP
jgi:hypothetical protein